MDLSMRADGLDGAFVGLLLSELITAYRIYLKPFAEDAFNNSL